MKDNYGIEEGAIATVAAGHDLILQDYQSDPKITVDAVARAVDKSGYRSRKSKPPCAACGS